jgi:hypothetical protein
VLVSLIAQLKSAAPAFVTDFALQEHTFFEQAQSYAARAEGDAQASLADYIRAHGWANAKTDQTYAALLKSVNTTKTTLASATAAVQSTKGTGPGMEATIRVIDPASLPASPVVSAGGTALGLFGGLFVGVLLGVLAVYVATPDHRAWDGELSNSSWIGVTWGPPRRSHRTRTRQRIESGRGVA